jgi:hypothetical protein
MSSDPHERMVGSLIDYLKSHGLPILCAAHPGYSQCSKVGRHEPDVEGQDADELINIGEVETCESLNTTLAREQLQDFATREMTGGKSKGKAVPFFLLVPESCVQEAWKTLRELGLADRPNVTVLKA